MPTYNYKARELIAKIVYYGPGRCGKTTNLQQIHARMRPESRSELLSVATETDRTIYFDLLPLNLGTISGMRFMVRLFTVPGQVYYSETRRLVLRGADGVVFVGDSQDHMMDENRESLRDLKENLAANGIDYDSIPLVLQYNKRDLPRLIPEVELDATLNDRGVKSIGAVAMNGTGVLETLRHITVAIFNHIKAGKSSQLAPGAAAKPKAPVAPGAPAPAPAVAPAPAPAPRPAPAAAAPAAAPTPQTADARRNALRSAGGLVEPNSPVLSGQPVPSASAFGGLSAAVPGAFAARPPPTPGTIGPEFYLEEFKGLALAHGQLAERLGAVEQELRRLGRENQEIRDILARSNV
ncbi:MAG: GTPase domain-containing protein [Deltaproteobacteria bacterium]|nr:GTPase domain-containing protein [Deltaproteobacteria bacterium]